MRSGNPIAALDGGVAQGSVGSFSYRAGELHVEDTCLSAIADSVQTPVYVYSQAAITASYQALAAAVGPLGVSICFAVKANGNLSVLKLLGDMGCGMDIVSGGELDRALVAGVAAGRIVFSGVGKKRSEIAKALQVGVHQINIESPSELDAVIDTARSLGIRAPVALRVNPDVDPRTHAKISTGRKGDKFGISFEEVPGIYAKAHAAPEIEVVGLAIHIGSQLLDLSPYREAYGRMASLVVDLREKGFDVERLDLGGGIGISYDGRAGPDIDAYAAIIAKTVGHLGCKLTVEPGRWLVGQAGILVSQVLYVKESAGVDIAIVDAAMNDLMRPALYDARHPVTPLVQPEVGRRSYQIVGPVCESTDSFGTFQDLPVLSEGDLVAFACAGAYGASMSSTYNARELVPEVLVDGDRFRIVRRRQDIQEMMALEADTAWQSAKPDGPRREAWR